MDGSIEAKGLTKMGKQLNSREHRNMATARGKEGANSDKLRFAFGKNWTRFLRTVNDTSIQEARGSIEGALGTLDLAGRSFVDVGCGSGLFSLAARMLGAKVSSFDYDLDSVRCAEVLKARYFPDDADWHIQQGSILDTAFVSRLEGFEIVYSWGVLHHTGDMWRALQNVGSLVRVGGHLVISIYNDQGHWSRIWLRIKCIYNMLPRPLKIPFVLLVMFPRELRSFIFSLLSLRPSRYIESWTRYQRFRGMSKWHDLVDWVGGLPFEVATPEQIIFFFQARGFSLIGLKTCAGAVGCNEFVFRLAPNEARTKHAPDESCVREA